MSAFEFEQPSEVNPKRMIDAADALLAIASRHGGTVRVGELRQKLDHVQSTDQYTPEELAAALAFLMRLGLVEHRNVPQVRP